MGSHGRGRIGCRSRRGLLLATRRVPRGQRAEARWCCISSPPPSWSATMNSRTYLIYLGIVLHTSACTEDESDRSPAAVVVDAERLACVPDLGVDASLNGRPIFTTTNDPTKMGFEWTKDVSQNQ